MTGRSAWWSRMPVPLILALAAVITALVVPPASSSSSSVGTAAPPTVDTVWPGAAPTVLPAVLPDGSTYQPMAFADDATSVGITTTVRPNGDSANQLVVLSGGTPRRLRAYDASGSTTFAALTVHEDQVYWLEIAWTGDEGRSRTSVWKAELAAGAPRRLVEETRDLIFLNTPFDLLVADDRLYWMVAWRDASEVRSIPIAGGAVNGRRLPERFTLTAWPWVTSTGQNLPGPARLLNLRTNQLVAVEATSSQILDCAPTWCRITTLLNAGQDVEHGVIRPDGSGYRVLSRNDERYPVNVGPALLDRFEFQGQAAANPRQPDRLWLHDLSTGRTVLATAAYTYQFGNRDGYVWWSTGNDEALQWHVLNLHNLA